MNIIGCPTKIYRVGEKLHEVLCEPLCLLGVTLRNNKQADNICWEVSSDLKF